LCQSKTQSTQSFIVTDGCWRSTAKEMLNEDGVVTSDGPKYMKVARFKSALKSTGFGSMVRQ